MYSSSPWGRSWEYLKDCAGDFKYLLIGSAACLAVGGALLLNGQLLEKKYARLFATRGVENPVVLQLDAVDDAQQHVYRARRDLERYKIGKTWHDANAQNSLEDITGARVDLQRAHAAGFATDGLDVRLVAVSTSIIQKGGADEERVYVPDLRALDRIRADMMAVEGDLKERVAPEILSGYRSMRIGVSVSEIVGGIALVFGGLGAGTVVFAGACGVALQIPYWWTR